MTDIAVAVDAEAAVRDWCNGKNLRAALTTQRSGPACLLLSRAGGLQESAGRDAAQITAIAHGPTKQAAANLAIAYANGVWNLAPSVIATGVYCNAAEVDSGPTELPDPSGTSRYLVVATFYLGPVR